MHRISVARNLPVATLRSTPREGDGSPSLRLATKEKRTTEARALCIKNAERQERRAYKKAGERGLEKRIARMQAHRDAEPVISHAHDGTPIESLARKKVVRKPAQRNTPRKPSARIHRSYRPEILERRKNNALLRDIKRAFKKALRYAARQSKKYGYSIYLIILELFYLKFKQFHNEPREA